MTRDALRQLITKWRALAQNYEEQRMRLRDDRFNGPTIADFEARCEVARACANELESLLAALQPREEPTAEDYASLLKDRDRIEDACIRFRAWLDHASRILGSPAGGIVIGKVDELKFPCDADRQARLRKADAPPAPQTTEPPRSVQIAALLNDDVLSGVKRLLNQRAEVLRDTDGRSSFVSARDAAREFLAETIDRGLPR